MINAVIFDMDGLLVDSEPMWDEARIGAFGADRLRWTDEDQLAIMGSSTQNWAGFMARRMNHEFSVDEIIERVLDQMVMGYRKHVPLLPGAREAVAHLAGHYTLGIASGSSHRLINAVLEGTGWTNVFTKIVSSDEVPHGKPAPDTYLEIARRLKLDPATMVVVEDSANGILAGHAAGSKVITVPSTYLSPPADVLAKADVVLDSLHDLTPDLIRSL